MSNKSLSSLHRWLYVGALVFLISFSVRAEWKFPVFSTDTLQPDAMDRAFECEVTRLMDKQAGQLEDVNAVVTRFGNTIVITGYALDEAGRERVDQLVLDAAGITRKEQGVATVVPANTLGCDGKFVPGNSKRRLTVKSGRDCSTLRAESGRQDEASGQVFNHVAVGAGDPDKQLARAELLAAQAKVALLDGAVVDAMDGNVIRLVAQRDVLYVLGGFAAEQQSAIRTRLDKLPGVTAVQFYTE
jgi:hypothetical protein